MGAIYPILDPNLPVSGTDEKVSPTSYAVTYFYDITQFYDRFLNYSRAA